MVVLLATGLAFSSGGRGESKQATTEARYSEAGHSIASWHELTFRAEKYFLSAETVMAVSPRLPEEQIKEELREPPEDLPRGLAVGDDHVTKLRLVTHLPFGRSEEASVWIAMKDGAVLQGEKHVIGGNPYWKLWRHGVGDIVQWRAKPLKSERKLPMVRWSQRKIETIHIPEVPHEGTAVTDPYALLYLVSTAGFDFERAALTALVLSRGKLVEIHFQVDGTVQTDVCFEQSFENTTNRRTGSVAAMKVVGTGTYVGQDKVADDVDTGFMGMQGGLTILLEPGTGIPLSISGHSKRLGEVTVRLTKARMVPRSTRVNDRQAAHRE